jgi:hypothetical protein
MSDPLDEHDAQRAQDRAIKYRAYGSEELAEALAMYEAKFGKYPTPSPARCGADYHCPNCLTDVRGISLSSKEILLCPLCGDRPGLVVLGEGPRGR